MTPNATMDQLYQLLRMVIFFSQKSATPIVTNRCPIATCSFSSECIICNIFAPNAENYSEIRDFFLKQPVVIDYILDSMRFDIHLIQETVIKIYPELYDYV